MDVQHLDYDDESLVRAALQAAYPSERPIFSQRRGAQIVHAAARELEGSGRSRPFAGGRVAALIAAAFTLLAGTAGAASAALPGERLYPIKHAVERAMVAIAGDDVEAARLELRFAERRLREASAIRSDADDPVDPELNQRFREHLDAAASLAGEQIAGEVEQLEQSRDAQRTGRADAALPVQDTVRVPDTVPAELVPQEEPDADGGDAPEPSPSPSPSASASPTPSPAPTPPTGVDPSPAPSPVGVATPGDGEPESDASPSPSPEAPADDDEEPLVHADAASR